MSYAAMMTAPPQAVRSGGESLEAKIVDNGYVQARERLIGSEAANSLAEHVTNTFTSLVRDHREASWDGDGAAALSDDAVRYALDFVLSLPPMLSNPSISANQFGDVEIEWYKSADNLVTLSIGEGGRYYFSALLGMERDSGSGYLGGLPFKVLRGAMRVSRA